MRKSIVYFLFAFLFSISLSTFNSCREKKTPGEKIEEGVRKTGEGIEEGAEKIGDDIERGVEKTGDKIEDATDNN